MAAPARILTLNLGTQNVSLAEFQTGSDGGLVLQAFRTTELLADPAAEATRVAQTGIAVREMTGALKARGLKVNYAVSAQSVFTRFVKLPAVAQEKVDQIVTFEAQQNVPFPINEVVWDYQLVGSGSEENVEVVLVAIKSDLLDELNAAVEGPALEPNIIDVAPMALFNAFRYNYADIAAGCTLIIDLGARTTNLIFVEPHKVFTRSIPIGGNTITAAIAKDFDEPFGAAEERKKQRGFVSLGGSYADPADPEIARLSKVIRNAMTKMHAEISRSISYYRSQQGGSAPQQVYICGGTATLPYMREFFSEKLQLPIDFFNPLRNVTINSGLDAAEIGRGAHLLGELVGLALRSTSNCPMELNLRPASVVRRQQLVARRPYLIAAAACLFLSIGGGIIYQSIAAAKTQAVIDSMTPELTQLKGYETKFTNLQNQIRARQDAAGPLLQAVEERVFWKDLLEDLNTRIPDRFVWITSLDAAQISADNKVSVLNVGTAGAKPNSAPATESTPAPGARRPPGSFNNRPAQPSLALLIKGFYLDNPEQAGLVDKFVTNLADPDSPYLVDLKDIRDTLTVRGDPNETEWAYPFELKVRLKQSIPLQ